MIGIYEIDIESDTFTNVNPAIYEGLGYSKEEVEGQPVTVFLSEESSKLWRLRREQIQAGKLLDSSVEYVCVAKDGTRMPVVIEAFYKIENGRITGAIVAVKELKHG